MVAQSTDLSLRLHEHRETLTPRDMVTYDGGILGQGPTPVLGDDIVAALSGPFTIAAVDAPYMHGKAAYDEQALTLQ
eukprot:gene13496-17160_t